MEVIYTELTLAMLLTLNRKTHKAYNRVREQNFALNGLLGFNLYGKTIGIIGRGKSAKPFVASPKDLVVNYLLLTSMKMSC